MGCPLKRRDAAEARIVAVDEASAAVRAELAEMQAAIDARVTEIPYPDGGE